ncbi:MAG: InlB B-repeat-containing protein [Firmicutes bacterium]|nr:InlB B-repeat-containing protein [Bacillota bacterium]
MNDKHRKRILIVAIIAAVSLLLLQDPAETLAATATGTTQTVKVQADGTQKKFRANVTYSVTTTDTKVTLECTSIRFETRSSSKNADWITHSRARYQGDIKTSYTGTKDLTFKKGYSAGDTKTVYGTNKSVSKDRTHVNQKITVYADVDWQGTWSGSKVSRATISINVPAKESYAVEYDANGGAEAPKNDVKWKGETLTLSTEKPVRSGYRFLGWNTDPMGTGTNYVPGQSYTANGQLRLYAQWEELHYDMTMEETVSDIDFRIFTADTSGDASCELSLGNEGYVLFPGLDKGADYTVTENSCGRYTPSYTVSEGEELCSKPSAEGTKGSALSTEKQTLKTDTTIDYNNEQTPPEGTNISLRKELAGDQISEADREKLFTFSYILRGLDPQESYIINMEKATDEDGQTQPNIDLAVAASGMATGTVRLHEGESAVIENLPDGAEYVIGENLGNFSAASEKADYTMVCEVTDGSDFTDADYKFWTAEELAAAKSSGRAAVGTATLNTATLASGYETVQEGAEVEYTFTNAKYSPRDISLQKVLTEDGVPVEGDSSEKFDIALKISGLQADTEYRTSDGPVTADEKGTCLCRFRLGSKERFSVDSLPGTARFELTEQAGAYIPSIEIKAGGEILHEETGSYGQPLETTFGDLPADLEAKLTNEKPRHANLGITKEFDGLYEEDTISANFTIDLAGLEAGAVYRVQKKNGEGEVFERESITAGKDGRYSYGSSLRDSQRLEILGLPVTAEYKITEGAAEGVIPTYVLTSDKAGIKVQGNGAGRGQALSTETETMTVDRDYSFYNDVPGSPEKTVSDGDGFTKYEEGEEIELMENYVPKRSGSWIYHISERLDVPISKYTLYDDLPPYVRTLIRDGTERGDSAPFRVYWNDGSVRRGGAVTDFDAETGEYFVREGGKTLFTILYDDQADIQAHLEIRVEDEELLLAGGQFDVYFKAFLDKKVTKNELVAAGCYDGEYFVFDNQASRLAGSYMSDTEPVRTLMPESGGLKVRKAVYGLDGLKTSGDRFRFEVDLTGLEGSETYTYDKTSQITASVGINGEGKAYVTATDPEGKPSKGVSARIIDDEDRVVANIGSKTAAEVPPGEYTVVFLYDGASVMSSLEIAEAGETCSALCDSVTFCSSAGEETFMTQRNGSASVIFTLTDGQTVSFPGLPDDCKYEVTEGAAANYKASYTFTQGAATVSKASDDAEAENKALSTGRNTFHEGRDVTVTYTNMKDDPDLKIVKVNEMGAPVADAELALYEGKWKLDPIEKGTTFIEGIENAEPVRIWRTDENGCCPDDAGQGIRSGCFRLPHGEYTLLELQVPDHSGLEVAQPVRLRVNENGTYNLWDDGTGRYGENRSSSAGLQLVDPYLTATDLYIRKIVTGNLGDLTKQFEFTVELSGLPENRTITEAYDPKIDPSEVIGYTSDGSGKAAVKIKLRSGEGKVIPAIPFGATYQVTEATSDHVAGYDLVSGSIGAMIEKEADSNGRVSEKSLATEKERVDLNEEAMYLTFRNNRDLATITGVPGYMKILILVFLTLAVLTVLWMLKRRTISEIRNK